MNYELRRYSFEETIGKGFNLYVDNFLKIIPVSLICQLVIFFLPRVTGNLFPFRLEYTASPFIETYSLIRNIINIGSGIVVNAILSAWIVYLVSNKFLENTQTDKIKQRTSVLPFIFPVIGLSITVALADIFAMLLLIIPGIIVALGFSLATQVLVIEKRKIIESMKRSWELTNGLKRLVLLFYGLYYLVFFVVYFVLFRIIWRLANYRELATYFNSLVGVFIYPIMSCILVVVYFNIRIEKEGFNIEHLVQQFTGLEVKSDCARTPNL